MMAFLDLKNTFDSVSHMLETIKVPLIVFGLLHLVFPFSAVSCHITSKTWQTELVGVFSRETHYPL